MANVLPATLVLTMEPASVGGFFLLLQHGFTMQVLVGSTLENLLIAQWQLTPEYVTQRIATIFLDSRPIDDLTTTIVREHSVLALSGAMPGLVGATMRRDGFYANLRRNITHQEMLADACQKIEPIGVKIFNVLLPELGPMFLRRGIIIGATELIYFIETKQGCSTAQLDGKSISPAELPEKIQASDSTSILLRIIEENT